MVAYKTISIYSGLNRTSPLASKMHAFAYEHYNQNKNYFSSSALKKSLTTTLKSVSNGLSAKKSGMTGSSKSRSSIDSSDTMVFYRT
jgi:hypothetical protein